MADDKVTTQVIDWKALVEQHEDLEEAHRAYEFTGRTFFEDDTNGVYDDS